MKRVNIYLTKKQWKTLKELSRDGLTLSEHIRRAIDLYLESIINKDFK